MTTMSMAMASRFRAVSTSVSPFTTDDPLEEMFTVSAERRFSANSKDTRVRVEGSKNRFTMVLPRSTGTFLISRLEISLNGSAVLRMLRICSALRGSSPTRSFPIGGTWLLTLPPGAKSRSPRSSGGPGRGPGPPPVARPEPGPLSRPHRAGWAAPVRLGPREHRGGFDWGAPSS